MTTISYEWIKDLDDDEEAKPIRGHAGYFITNKGRVFSTKRARSGKWGVPATAGRWLKISPSTSYYYKVSLGYGRSYDVHRLVGTHFCVSYNTPYDEIGHLDETLPFPQINYASNLRPMSLSENRKDAYTKGRNTRHQ